ncbi:MAG: hypothetical protein ACLVK4_16120 [Alistipes shahii]|uniref:hypothetical protein n=1 Tax=Alistipes shahii TaxID=328814 RepID=UPI00399C7F9C
MNGYGYWEFQGISGAMHHHLGRWTPENKEHALLSEPPPPRNRITVSRHSG